MTKLSNALAILILLFLAGCSSLKLSNDGGMLQIDAGDDQTAFVGDTVNFDGNCNVKAGFFQREADWDFGDGSGEDGITASHIYTRPGDYTATLTVKIVFFATISKSQEINVKINPLPAEAFLPDETQAPEDAVEYMITNQLAAFLPDGRMVIVGTVNPEDPSEIAIAVETAPENHLFKQVTNFMQMETESLPDNVKAKDNENITISAGEVLFNVCLNNGDVSTAP